MIRESWVRIPPGPPFLVPPRTISYHLVIVLDGTSAEGDSWTLVKRAQNPGVTCQCGQASSGRWQQATVLKGCPLRLVRLGPAFPLARRFTSRRLPRVPRDGTVRFADLEVRPAASAAPGWQRRLPVPATLDPSNASESRLRKVTGGDGHAFRLDPFEKSVPATCRLFAILVEGEGRSPAGFCHLGRVEKRIAPDDRFLSA